MSVGKPMALDWNVAQYISAGTIDEPLVPVATCEYWIAQPLYYLHGLKGALPQIWVREGVYERLVRAAQNLPSRYRLVLLDGWRPKSIQQFLFSSFREKVASANPTMSDEEVELQTLTFAAHPSDDPQCPSPHITGGAIDVTLADADGTLLDMGSEVDEISERSWTAAPVPVLQTERRKDLLETMVRAGFTNLPSEWWHFDYGNWVWAWYSNHYAALYGPIAGPTQED
ncbi:MAG: M15 family metallopeptidase [Pseudomonadota bacterium]